ncbi:succinate dehydrogenase cytochrome b subunit [Lawsonella clevelandensis]|uniref:succinate dehydrogenase cytochrome b subunit n=1 Tax=Lawsonella clevelandensis TaxID=1528099 RepID=UPI0006B543C7|nr:succinate dehydrogenase cytochrome b subunit [Lawsonella clevelandensis]
MAGNSTAVAERTTAKTGTTNRAHLRKKPFYPSWVAKFIMAITGWIFSLFLLVHMIGNLKMFRGTYTITQYDLAKGYSPDQIGQQAQAMNDYAHWLRTLLAGLFGYEGVLWVFRIVLLVCIILHFASGILLAVRGKQAHGNSARKVSTARGVFAKFMIVSGLILACFIVFHILDLTTGDTGAEFQHGDAYNNMIASFDRPAVAAFYAITMLLLLIHIEHGIATTANDFGATGKRLRVVFSMIGGILSGVIVLGNLAIVICVATGVIQPVDLAVPNQAYDGTAHAAMAALSVIG